MKTFVYMQKVFIALLIFFAAQTLCAADQSTSNQSNLAVLVKDSSLFFSGSYFEARNLFLKKAQTLGAKLIHLPLTATGTNNRPLSIDIAWFGNTSPKKVLIHSSGLHGVEGFAGSAIQIALLDKLPHISRDGAIILVHIINPYGMDWLRRFNESNVDLNRNFKTLSQDWGGTPDVYHDLNDFLNPSKPPAEDCFTCKVLYQLIRIGPSQLRKAVASGQNDYPRGLFFRGHQLEEGPSVYRNWLRKSFNHSEQIIAIDVHTGLGEFGQNSLFHKIRGTESSHLSNVIGHPLPENYSASSVVGYAFKGGLCDLFEELFPDKRIDFLTQEFGTYSKLKVLNALRTENQDHHYGHGQVDSWAKFMLKDTFCPGSPEWREKILVDGLDLTYRAASFLFEE